MKNYSSSKIWGRNVTSGRQIPLNNVTFDDRQPDWINEASKKNDERGQDSGYNIAVFDFEGKQFVVEEVPVTGQTSLGILCHLFVEN